jgi:transcriptional regulator with XRE-family HTH domain
LLDLSERAGLGEGTITKWRKNRSPQVEALEAAINALGYELTVKVQS